MRVSLKDVAERAGVSIKTVSNVVNKYQHVTPAMRARVQEAIDELGYRPNLTARHLRKGRTGIIALAVPELGNPYFAELAGAVIDAAAEHDFTVLLDHTRGEREREVLVSQGFRARVIDGLILSPLELEAEDLRAREDDVPLVLLGERSYDLDYDHIAIDNIAASRTAVRHLIGRGRTSIAYLGARTDSANRPAHLRLQGWREELAAAGISAPESLVGPVGGWDRWDGAKAMARMLDAGVRPDAVFAYNDLVAIGAMRVLHERGLRVPWDVAVVGFDDIAEGQFGAVTLTTVAPDKQAIARLAVESLLAKLAHPERTGGRELVADFRLVERESTLGRR
ncbi:MULTISPECIES: LacI family DNA-binding transcriptional regulator [unclassified Streptomyces]|uniref:substrate-binding domain-containing protein n=1 Tax=unclassified Streptomyces TaxID=2593676 RepID=UPI00136D2975|nr:substrate-binding domain-containing protein [Streptomyces sp. SID335]MYZ19425.1 substrate-binding domain-containing protein [Streptomyces sp. SID337]NDZ91793.1 LacI family transcriptional regulator [Streptomyces sp. SID10115]NDZ98220.1 LacI family transcriptional regulator [Streptomyces sp. SID10116]NEB42836.1 LacI family transcriptional regulator [Streptomyces sp. SID339]